MPYMNFDFSDNYYLYVIAYIVLPVLFFYKAKVVRTVDSDLFMSKSSTDQLRGFFIIVMVIHHISQRMPNPGLLTPFNYMGYYAVAIFFFLSGFGLTKSFNHKKTYLDHFLLKKVVKIYVPFFIMNILTVVFILLKGDALSIREMLEFSLSIKLVDTTQWFIITILIFYVFFWFSFVAAKSRIKSQIYVTVLVILFIVGCKYLKLGGWWYYSSLCFPLGVVFAFNENTIFRSIYHKYNLYITLSLILFIFTIFLFIKSIVPAMGIFSCVIFTIFVLLFSFKIIPSIKLFSIMGNISMEIYMIHMKVLALFVYFFSFKSSLIVIPYLIIVVLLSVYFNKFNNLVYNRFLNLKVMA